MFALITTDGALSEYDLRDLCAKEKWVPLVVAKARNHEPTEEQPEPRPVLLVFHTVDLAERFKERNYPKKWRVVIYALCASDIETMKAKGWGFMILEWPRKMNASPDYELTYEIHYTNYVPGVFEDRGEFSFKFTNDGQVKGPQG